MRPPKHLVSTLARCLLGLAQASPPAHARLPACLSGAGLLLINKAVKPAPGSLPLCPSQFSPHKDPQLVHVAPRDAQFIIQEHHVKACAARPLGHPDQLHSPGTHKATASIVTKRARQPHHCR